MSEPIRSKNGDISKAPTPQNTPASITNSFLKNQKPTVPSINEENEVDLANNPALMSMIQDKLLTLVGKESNYISTLPTQIKNRVFGLKSIQSSQLKLEQEFQKELLDLEKKYFKKYEPLYEKRKKIVNGELEPTEEEIEEGKEQNEDEDDEDNEDKLQEVDENDEAIVPKGIPGFWLTALENLTTVSETITERDSDILTHLIDIRMEYLSTPGFELVFEFNENDYFSNRILTKTYHYQAELGYSGDFVYDHADGSEINWKSKDVNPTINIERRKQRNKNTKQTRTIEKLTPTESFFNFFDPPAVPKINDDEDVNDEDAEEDDEDEEDLEGRLELDYQLGEEIKDRLIPRAIDWFTGDAVEYGFPEDLDEEYDSDEDEEDEDDEDDNSEAPKQAQPECKQQ